MNTALNVQTIIEVDRLGSNSAGTAGWDTKWDELAEHTCRGMVGRIFGRRLCCTHQVEQLRILDPSPCKNMQPFVDLVACKA